MNEKLIAERLENMEAEIARIRKEMEPEHFAKLLRSAELVVISKDCRIMARSKEFVTIEWKDGIPFIAQGNYSLMAVATGTAARLGYIHDGFLVATGEVNLNTSTIIPGCRIEIITGKPKF
jgi:hypothetical protein